MIEFKALTMKAKTDNMYAIFLLKKNVRSDIIKTILGYLSIVVPGSLKEWKVEIILIGQEFKSTEYRQDYRTEIETIYKIREALMNIRKSKDSYNKDRKLKKEKEIRKCYKYNKVEYFVKNYKSE